MRRTICAALLVLALGFAGCGGGGNDTTGNKGSTETTAAKPANDGGGGKSKVGSPEFVGSFPPAGLEVGTPAGAGPVLVDTARKTLYRFSKDTQAGGRSTCYGKCAELWRPVPSGGKPRVREGAEGKLAATITRTDGLIQATYDGWPLYTYIKEYGEKTHGAKTVFGGNFRPLRSDGTVVVSVSAGG